MLEILVGETCFALKFASWREGGRIVEVLILPHLINWLISRLFPHFYLCSGIVCRWMMALKQEIGRVKAKMLSAETPQSADGEAVCSVERIERKLCVSALRRLPGNLECAECSSTEGF